MADTPEEVPSDASHRRHTDARPDLNRKVGPDGRTQLRMDLTVLGEIVDAEPNSAKTTHSDHVRVAVDRDRGISVLEVRFCLPWSSKTSASTCRARACSIKVAGSTPSWTKIGGGARRIRPCGVGSGW
jgi:hypothetical protein